MNVENRGDAPWRGAEFWFGDDYFALTFECYWLDLEHGSEELSQLLNLHCASYIFF